MRYPPLHTSRLLARLALSAGWLASSACDSETGVGPRDNLCPSCDANTGGETSDFPAGELQPCAAAVLHQTLSAAEAEALDFVDLAGLEQIVERDLDVPLRWVPDPWRHESHSAHAEVASDLASETQLHVRTQVVSYTHVAPDPTRCDGVTCIVEGEPVEQAHCPPFLLLGLEVSLHTDDGAVEASMTGELAQWAPGYEHGASPDEHHNHSYANLHDVLGTLQFTSEHEPDRGRLTLQVDYDREQGATALYLWPELVFEQPQQTSYCVPVRGEWGDTIDPTPPQRGVE